MSALTVTPVNLKQSSLIMAETCHILPNWFHCALQTVITTAVEKWRLVEKR